VRTVSFVGRRYETFNSLEEYKTWKANAAKVLDICVPIAERIGISLALENHKDRVVDEEVEVLRKYSSAYLGALVDFGNNIAMCDDPDYVVQSLAPFVKSCHMRNMGVRNYPDGFLLSEVLFEDGFLDVVAMWKRLKKSNPALNPTHELITRDPLKVPVLTDKYWVTWPSRSGRYLADTIRLINMVQSKKPLPVVSNLSLPERGRIEEQNNINCFEWGRTQLT
jgi:3-oxoisoapionate decarboxylase